MSTDNQRLAAALEELLRAARHFQIDSGMADLRLANAIADAEALLYSPVPPDQPEDVSRKLVKWMNAEEGRKAFQDEIKRHNALPPIYSSDNSPADVVEWKLSKRDGLD